MKIPQVPHCVSIRARIFKPFKDSSNQFPGRREPYLSYRPTRLQRLAESIPELLKLLQIWAQELTLSPLKNTGSGADPSPPPPFFSPFFTPAPPVPWAGCLVGGVGGGGGPVQC